jgi:hypothetical protein
MVRTSQATSMKLLDDLYEVALFWPAVVANIIRFQTPHGVPSFP